MTKIHKKNESNERKVQELLSIFNVVPPKIYDRLTISSYFPLVSLSVSTFYYYFILTHYFAKLLS